uniref:Uncharacterized protein n=1 Tax=Homalodisca liturata TaxID=320908 RepID=A0A1B6JG53_9HEMI
MEGPRLSIASSSSCGSSLDCGSADNSPLPSPSPQAFPPFSVGSVVVNGDNNNIHHGNLTTVTYNQYIVPGGDQVDLPPVKINSETHSRFFPIEVPEHKSSGNKEDLAGLQRRWCCLIGALVSLSFITLLSTSIFSLSSFRSNSPPPPPTVMTTLEETSSLYSSFMWNPASGETSGTTS